MNRSNKDIQDKIKSGEYYLDAKVWYARKYLYPIIERSLMFFSIIFISMLLLICLLNLDTISKKEFKEKFIINISDFTQKYADIKPIAKGSNESYVKFVEYMIKRYVENYESYQYSQLEKHVNFI